MLKLICVSSAAAFLACASAPAFAQAQNTPPAASNESKSDSRSNEIVCQKQEVIGSRLAVKRVCKTRAEWADARLEDRRAVDKIQTERAMPGN
jgi:invasion protein IalB